MAEVKMDLQETQESMPLLRLMALTEHQDLMVEMEELAATEVTEVQAAILKSLWQRKIWTCSSCWTNFNLRVERKAPKDSMARLGREDQAGKEALLTLPTSSKLCLCLMHMAELCSKSKTKSTESKEASQVPQGKEESMEWEKS